MQLRFITGEVEFKFLYFYTLKALKREDSVLIIASHRNNYLSGPQFYEMSKSH